MKNKNRLKLFEEFDENEIIQLPGEEDYDYVDLEDKEEFDEYKNEIYTELKYSSEQILPIIGIENETEWFLILNTIILAENNDEFQNSLIILKDFLSNFDVKALNDIFNVGA
jgi:GTP-sensing pleiotropic transcriptional regulator CodY